MSQRDSKTPNSDPDAKLAASRSEWSKRLALFGRGNRGAPSGPASDPVASQDEAEWEDIPARPTRPLPALEDVPPLSRAGSSRIDAEREELEIAVAAAQREIADREAESVGLRGALGAAHQQLRAREAEITDLTTRLAVANATTNARQDELENLGGRYSGVEEKRNVLERETQVLRDELQRAAEEAEKREIKIDNLRSARATLEETIEARNRIIRARDEELAAGEQELQAHRDRIANQYKSVADRDAEIALLQDQLLAEQERTHSLELEVGARDQMLDHQREKLAERDEQLADLLATFDVVERTIKTRPGVADIGEGAASNESTPPAPPQKPPAGPVRTARNDAAAPSAPGTEARDTSEATEDAALDEGDDEDPSPEPEAATSEQDLDAACPDGEAEADQADEPEPPVAEEEAAEPEPMEADANGAEANDADEAEALDATSESDATEDGAEEVTAEGEAASPAETETAATDDQTEEAESAQNEDPFATERTILEPSGDLFLTRPPPRSEIFDWWRDQRIAEGLAPLSVASFDALLADTVGRLCEARPDDTIEVASLCGADATLELRLANALEAAGHENYTIDCIDDREGWHEIRDERASDAGFDDRIDSLPASTAALALDQKIDVFVADGSLAYVADLPALLAWLRNGWKDDSVMVIGGTLGACAAGEAPEHVETIDRIWNVMPDQYMLNHITGSEQANFSAEKPASDAPGGGGPLAPGETPLLPLLLDEFCFEVFAPFGNLINAFVGPEIGANFDPDVEADQQFIETFAKLDEGQIDAGAIHPLHLVAVLRGSASDEPFLLEGRAPERCLALGE